MLRFCFEVFASIGYNVNEKSENMIFFKRVLFHPGLALGRPATEI